MRALGYADQARSNLPDDRFHWAIEDPELGLLELTCENGYIVTQYDLGTPDIREVRHDRPLNDGTVDRTLYTGARMVSLTIQLDRGIMGSTAQMRSRLAAYLHPRRRPVLSFVESDWPLRRQVRTRGKAARGTVTQRNNNVMQANFVVPDGMIESYELHAERVGVSGEDFVNVIDVLNAGDVDSHWVCEIRNITLSMSGESAGAGIELVLDPTIGLGGPFEDGTRSIKMMMDISSNERLFISSIDKSAVIETPDGRTRTAFQFVDKGSDWWQLPPGSHQFGFWTLDENGERISPKQDRAHVWGGVGADGETAGENGDRSEYSALTIEGGESGAQKAFDRITAFMTGAANDDVVPNPADDPSQVGDVITLFADGPGVGVSVWIERTDDSSDQVVLELIDPSWTGQTPIGGCRLLDAKPTGMKTVATWQSDATLHTGSVWSLPGFGGGTDNNQAGYSAFYWRDTWFA